MEEKDTWVEDIAGTFGLDVETVQLLESYLLKIIEVNKKINLTRIETLKSGRVLHLEDSLAGFQELKEAPAGLYADLGTGGGFPGVPLALVSGRDTLLVDSVKKKVTALEEVVRESGVQDRITCYGGRIEELALEKKGRFAVLTARALSSLSSLMELASPLLEQKGRLICYKANIEDSELEHAVALKETLAMRLVSDRSFMLSDGVTTRRIVVFEKVGYPTLKLPRRTGMAQKKPL